MERMSQEAFYANRRRIWELQYLQRFFASNGPAESITRRKGDDVEDVRRPFRGPARRFVEACRASWPPTVVAHQSTAHLAALSLPYVLDVVFVEENIGYRVILQTEDLGDVSGPRCVSRALAVCASICELGVQRLERRIEPERRRRREERKRLKREARERELAAGPGDHEEDRIDDLLPED